jgi:hypothetical protein
MPIVTTAKDGQTLRDYANLIKHDKNVIIFPESGLSANEQTAFMLSTGDKYTEVVTFSSFIISDAAEDQLKILDDESFQCPVHHGDSINKVTMGIWRRETIGDSALEKLTEARTKLNSANSEVAINKIIKSLSRQLSDSVEKMFFLKVAYDKIDRLSLENSDEK